MSSSGTKDERSQEVSDYRPFSWGDFFRHVIGKDTMLWVAMTLAIVSTVLFPQPLQVYRNAIDVKTLACLASLMVASGGFVICGLFDLAAARLVNKCRSARALMAAMIFSTFFASMFITNDVALIVLVPMTLIAFKRAGYDPILTVVLQTVAANVGSILLPMGNPQNLYLYSRYAMGFLPFFRTVLPLSIAGAGVLAVFCVFAGNKGGIDSNRQEPTVRWRGVWPFAGLFFVAVLAVFGAIDYRVALAASLLALFLKGRNLVWQVDYGLLLTFIGFFIFVGNISHIPQAESWLREFVGPKPFWAAVLTSQIISNVPGAVLISEFTDDRYALLAGVSAGGCGTLIASMASLISYKLYVRAGGRKKRYLTVFTVVNILFLAVMTGVYMLYTTAI